MGKAILCNYQQIHEKSGREYIYQTLEQHSSTICYEIFGSLFIIITAVVIEHKPTFINKHSHIN